MTAIKLKKLAYVFFAFGIGALLYILIHETGHLIVMLSAGAVIDDFSILTAHVSAHGGKYTDGSEMWMNANGAVLPIICSMAAMLFYKRSNLNSFYRIFYFFITFVPIGSAFAWVIIPFLYAQGKAPAGDDVTKFLEIWTKHHSPYIVSGVAALVIAAGIYIAVTMGIFRGYMEEVKLVKTGSSE